MSPELNDELDGAPRTKYGQLGKVIARHEAGRATNRELVDDGAAANQAVASNLRRVINTLHEREPLRLDPRCAHPASTRPAWA